MHQRGETIHLPSPKAFFRKAMPPLVEGTIGPGVLFYLVLLTGGFRWALIAAVAWSYAAIIRRLVRHEPVPGILALGTLLVSVRTAVAFVTGSAFAYFVQPTAGTFLVALIFIGTAAAGRPLVERMAHDFCPIDPELLASPFLRRFFLRVSWLWSVVLTTNAGLVLWLLLRTSVKDFVVERTVVSTVLTVGG
ncbi:MAG: VC0807 family protein, partial [Acidimicrobiales bacterium]